MQHLLCSRCFREMASCSQLLVEFSSWCELENDINTLLIVEIAKHAKNVAVSMKSENMLMMTMTVMMCCALWLTWDVTEFQFLDEAGVPHQPSSTETSLSPIYIEFKYCIRNCCELFMDAYLNGDDEFRFALTSQIYISKFASAEWLSNFEVF